MEDACVTAAASYLKEAGVAALTVARHEVPKRHTLDFRDGETLRFDRISDVARRVLREQFWRRVEADDANVHFGYDYYMHIGVSPPCHASQRRAVELGLFVEDISLSDQPDG